MASTNGNGKGSIDTCTEDLSPAAKAVLKGMKESGGSHTVVDMMRYAGEPYARGGPGGVCVRPAAMQRFGHEIMPKLTESSAIEKVGTKPTMYVVTEQGHTYLKSSQTP